ncbi:putative type II secretion system protein D precursor [Ferrovum sp. JA12]|uniref:type II secretion system secretin GspD n=1 Tax=Ferrovum sp. JA12 TaxID=1356299 RepID=UPI0007024786|nr:type II secretion system secretin GspD [Ferrovum sp. JA12]KRH78285.1 putative type II secretion system protein D precursor [Ferrovum sp. JA12]
MRWLKIIFLLFSLTVCQLLFAGQAKTDHSAAQALAEAGPVAEGDLIRLSFTDADTQGVIRAVGEAVGTSILVDPRVKGTITLTSDRPLTKKETLSALAATLRLQGYALVEASNGYKVVPEADAKLQGSQVSVDASGVGGKAQIAPQGDQLLTQVFRLKYESANNLIPVLRPLIATNNSITAYPANNTLVITDYAENLRRIQRIIQAIDTPLSNEVQIIPIKNGLAIDIAELINKLGQIKGTTNEPNLLTTAIADTRTNSIVLRAPTVTRANEIKGLIEKLDTQSARPGNIWVVPLKNAEAIKLAQTLRGIISMDTSILRAPSTPSFAPGGGMGGIATGVGSGATGGTTSPSSYTGNATANPLVGASATEANIGPGGGGGGSGGAASGHAGTLPAGMIQADSTTNSIIITANEQVYRNLRNVIDKLDSRRAQIYVESMIVEVADNKAQEFGVQLQGLLGGGTTQTFVGTSFNASVPGGNITALGTSVGALTSAGATATSTTVLPAPGSTVGVIHSYNGIPTLAGLARAVSTITGVNVLSTPNLLTLDNEIAQIIIATNVPFVTGQYAQTTGLSTVAPFTTVDRQDIGLILKIKPQISEGGLVRLQIYEESSTIDPATTNNTYGPTYNKRSLESNVLVEDGQLVALGGLLSDSYQDTEEKTPFLGDVPILGALFRYEAKTRVKENLMLFLRPYIIRDTEQSDSLTNDRYSLIKNVRETFKPHIRILSNETLTALPNSNQGGSTFINPEKANEAPTAIPLPNTQR